jgi:hypothetical protein
VSSPVARLPRSHDQQLRRELQAGLIHHRLLGLRRKRLLGFRLEHHDHRTTEVRLRPAADHAADDG